MKNYLIFIAVAMLTTYLCPIITYANPSDASNYNDFCDKISSKTLPQTETVQEQAANIMDSLLLSNSVRVQALHTLIVQNILPIRKKPLMQLIFQRLTQVV